MNNDGNKKRSLTYYYVLTLLIIFSIQFGDYTFIL